MNDRSTNNVKSSYSWTLKKKIDRNPPNSIEIDRIRTKKRNQEKF